METLVAQPYAKRPIVEVSYVVIIVYDYVVMLISLSKMIQLNRDQGPCCLAFS